MTVSGIEIDARHVMPGAAIVPTLRALALALPILAAAAVACARADEAPTSLLPAPPAPGTQSPAPNAPQSTPPGENAVQVQQLKGVDYDAFGTLDESHGGLPASLWANTDPALVAKLLPVLGPSNSRTFQNLIRRLLLSVAQPPGATSGAAGDPSAAAPANGESLVARRARALWTLGAADELATFLKSLPLPALTPSLRRLRADTALLVGDSGTACAEAGPLAAASATDPYPVELRVYCQYAAGQAAAASLGIDVLREQGINDPAFFALADALGGTGPVPKTGVADPAPLILAMGRLAKTEQPMPAATAAPIVLRAIALVAGAPLEVRLVAGERAEAVGALDTDTLRRLYESVPFTADELVNAETKATPDKNARSRALLLQAAERQAAPLGKAGLIARALNAADGPPSFAVQARLFAPQIAALQPSNDIALFAPVLTRALLAAHQTDAARNWVGWARALAAADPSAGAAAAGLEVLSRIAKLDDRPFAAEGLDAWRKAGAGLPADRADRRTALGLALLNALGEPLPPGAWLSQIDGTAPITAQVPRPALALGLDAATADKRLGETTLFAYAVAGDGTFAQTDVATLARLVTALKGAGFDDDARALALEAALANGV